MFYLVNKDGDPFHGDKADLLNVIAPKGSVVSKDNFDGLLVDLSVVIRSEAAVVKTSQYSYANFAQHVLRRLEKRAVGIQAKRLDIVADMYQDYSIKNNTHASRGTGGKLNFEEDDIMPDEKKVVEFLSNSENKTKLNVIIQKHCGAVRWLLHSENEFGHAVMD